MTAWPWLVGFTLVAGGIAFTVQLRRRWLTRAARQADAEIAARGYRYRFDTFDESLRLRTEARRQKADSIKRDGRLLETQDDRVSRIHLVR